MKIYISVDIEGISGVTNWGFTHEGGYNYERARRFMTEEVNAVIRGAKKAGAEEILVNDSHGPMTSILIEELDEDVVLISGNKKILGMMEGIDNTFDAVMLIGYHGRHNTSGILAHSYNGSVVSEIKLNGRVDLLIESQNKKIIIDYKTGKEKEGQLDFYSILLFGDSSTPEKLIFNAFEGEIKGDEKNVLTSESLKESIHNFLLKEIYTLAVKKGDCAFCNFINICRRES